MQHRKSFLMSLALLAAQAAQAEDALQNNDAARFFGRPFVHGPQVRAVQSSDAFTLDLGTHTTSIAAHTFNLAPALYDDGDTAALVFVGAMADQPEQGVMVVAAHQSGVDDNSQVALRTVALPALPLSHAVAVAGKQAVWMALADGSLVEVNLHSEQSTVLPNLLASVADIQEHSMGTLLVASASGVVASDVFGKLVWVKDGVLQDSVQLPAMLRPEALQQADDAWLAVDVNGALWQLQISDAHLQVLQLYAASAAVSTGLVPFANEACFGLVDGRVLCANGVALHERTRASAAVRQMLVADVRGVGQAQLVLLLDDGTGMLLMHDGAGEVFEAGARALGPSMLSQANGNSDVDNGIVLEIALGQRTGHSQALAQAGAENVAAQEAVMLSAGVMHSQGRAGPVTSVLPVFTAPLALTSSNASLQLGLVATEALPQTGPVHDGSLQGIGSLQRGAHVEFDSCSTVVMIPTSPMLLLLLVLLAGRKRARTDSAFHGR